MNKQKPKTVALHTLGCKVNQYDTEAITEIFKDAGYELVDFDDNADIYVINTCTVTGLSARKSRQAIRRAKNTNKDAIVVVTGCYSQTAPGEVEKIPDVDIIIGTSERANILKLINEYTNKQERINAVKNIMHNKEFENLRVKGYSNKTRAFLKVQDGCSQFCSYCIIPYARGPIRSRQLEDIIDEVTELAKNGFKELVLTGIHLASYGKDLKTISLIDLIREVHQLEGIERIRLGSIEPMTITEEFVLQASRLPKLCPHYHLSLQSGCDETLKRMNRKYNTEDYSMAVSLLRDNIPDVAISTDIMTGFPGETEEEFQKTMEFVKKIQFAQMHVFKYSPREGTPAAAFKDQLDGITKEKRSTALIKLAAESSLEFNKRYEEKVLSVLFEQEVKDEKGLYEGLTPNYIRVICPASSELIGNIVDVKIEKAYSDYVIASLYES
jgi:threonylcarbamoyladenosine tRNA methylthiotransferase MtaB